MDTKLTAVVVPVSDVDRSRHFYRALGFRLDLDQAERDVRVVQLTRQAPCARSSSAPASARPIPGRRSAC